MRIVRWTADDPTATHACYELAQAVQAADDPCGAPQSARSFRVRLERAVQPMELWFVPGETPGSVQAWYHLNLPDLDNRDRAGVNVLVHPAFRRRGLGTALLRHAAQRAAANGRSALTADAIQGTAEVPSAGEAFARRAGGAPGLVFARRVLLTERTPLEQLALLRAEAARAAAGYSLVSWVGPTPDEYLSGLAMVFNALNDAPRDPGNEAQVWDTQRIRERIDAPHTARGGRYYSVAAMHDATGEMAGYTSIEVTKDHPEWGDLHVTAVARQHRGHRLGLLVKSAIHEWLAAAEPDLRRVVTWNAAINKHMIAINETLGYELLDPQWQSYDLPVADALAS